MRPGWRRLVKPVATAGLLLVGWWVAPLGLRRVEWFRIRRVELVGAKYLSAAEVVRALGLGPGASVFDSNGRLAARVLRVPGVLEAQVSGRLMGTLVVRLREAEPVALTPEGGRLALMDRRGRILPFDPTRVALDLPVAPADSAVGGLMERLRDTDRALFARIESASRRQNTIVLEARGCRLLFRVAASTQEIQEVAVVAAQLERKGTRCGEVDGRFQDRVLVRGMGA